MRFEVCGSTVLCFFFLMTNMNICVCLFLILRMQFFVLNNIKMNLKYAF